MALFFYSEGNIKANILLFYPEYRTWSIDMFSSGRSRESEIMDAGEYTDQELRGDFKNIRMVNRLLRTYDSMIRDIEAYREKCGLHEFTILDVGTGMADIPLELARHFNSNGTRVLIKGIDPNPRAINVARNFINGQQGIDFEARSIQDFSSDERFDFVISNHTLHHIPDDDIVETLNKMHSLARCALIISDIYRTHLGKIGSAFISKFIGNRLTSNDTPASVRRALSKPELRRLISISNIRHYHLRYTFPYRYILVADAM
jgi:2-polyprenyl-3-methyl-5-hydroxy-6-metoxy-1,4-benzoquinol methylase